MLKALYRLAISDQRNKNNKGSLELMSWIDFSSLFSLFIFKQELYFKGYLQDLTSNKLISA